MKVNFGTYPVKTVITMNFFNDTMDSSSISYKNQRRFPPAGLFTHFASFINFESSFSVQTHFKLGKTFVDNPAFINALVCPGYSSYDFI